MHVACAPAVAIHFDVKHALGDDAPLTGRSQARVLNRVLDVEQHARPGAAIALVHEHRAAFQQITVALKGEVDDRIEQRMPRTDERCERLALRRHQ